jgi:hypothetical protein
MPYFFLFGVMWSPKDRHAITDLGPSDPGYVHIKCLEFAIILLQLVAIIICLSRLTFDPQQALLPDGLPAPPVLLVCSDNTSSIACTSKVSFKCPQAQQVIALYTEVLCLSNVSLNSTTLKVASTLALMASHDHFYLTLLLLITTNRSFRKTVC